MSRRILFQIIFLFFIVGCKTFIEKPVLSYSPIHGVLVRPADAKVLDLLAVNMQRYDTITYFSLSHIDTLRNLECETTYAFYFRYAGENDYSFLDSVNYQPNFCKENLAFLQLAETSSGGNYLIQDFQQGAIYTIGEHGRLIHELDSASGFVRGFDIKDSLLAWCSDSSQLTVKNLSTYQRRVIDFDSTVKLHHDLVVHYPYVTALYNKKKYREFKSHKVIEEGLLRIDLQTGDIKFWSIHDFLSDGIVPLENAKGSFVTAHGNSVDVDQNGDFYISFRDFNQVWKISPDFSTVHYRIGLNTPLTKSTGDNFIGQHSIDIISPDVFYLFDNGSVGRKQAKSKIVKVSVDPPALSYKIENILTLPDSLSTIRMGSVHALGNRLVISTFNKGFHILEIDTTGTIKNHLTSSKSHAIKVLPVGGIQKY